MALLGRYKRAGGFVQILNLIETCGPTKQDKFLTMIEEEDPNWAGAIRKKMIDIKRILSWDDNTRSEIFSRIQELTLAVAMAGMTDEEKEKVHSVLGSHSFKRKLRDQIESVSPSEAEIFTSNIKIVEEVREMIKQGFIQLNKIDPEVAIEEDIEEKLMTGVLIFAGEGKERVAPKPVTPLFEEEPSQEEKQGAKLDFAIAEAMDSPPESADPKAKDEIRKLKKQVLDLNTENHQLKSQVRILENKLDQIKKIA